MTDPSVRQGATSQDRARKGGRVTRHEMAVHVVTDLLLEAFSGAFSVDLPALIVELVALELGPPFPDDGCVERACRAYLSAWDEHKPDLPTAMRAALRAAKEGSDV